MDGNKKKFLDAESEKMLVCQMILRPDIISDVYNEVKPEMFSDADYRTGYEYLLKAFNMGSVIDQTMFAVGCEKLSMDKKMEITSATFTSSNWKFYADRVRNAYLGRTCLSICREVCGELTAENASESIARISGLASSALDDVGGGKRTVFGSVGMEFAKVLDYRMKHRGELSGYDTGLNCLNEALGGLPNEYIIIAARPSMGKTALGEQIALKLSEKIKVCFWELEMSEVAMFERAVSSESRVEMARLRNAYVSRQQLGIVTGKLQALADNENLIIRTGERRLNEIITTSRAEVRSRGCKAIMIDHAGLIRPGESHRSSWEGFVEISHALQGLQRELQVPVVVFSQLGREAEGAKSTTMANLRGSGAFEEDADVIIAIERERAKSATEFQIPTVLNIQKNRNGVTGPVRAVFMPKIVRFVDAVNDQPGQEAENERAS